MKGLLNVIFLPETINWKIVADCCEVQWSASQYLIFLFICSSLDVTSWMRKVSDRPKLLSPFISRIDQTGFLYWKGNDWKCKAFEKKKTLWGLSAVGDDDLNVKMLECSKWAETNLWLWSFLCVYLLVSWLEPQSAYQEIN